MFGAKCFVYIDRASRLKMQDHCWVGYFCGYPFNSKAYLVYDPARMNVFVRYHVLFDERVVYGDEIGGRKREREGLGSDHLSLTTKDASELEAAEPSAQAPNSVKKCFLSSACLLHVAAHGGQALLTHKHAQPTR